MKLKIVIPKGRIFERIKKVLNDAGYIISDYERNYRPKCNVEDELFTIYASSKSALNDAVGYAKHNLGFESK